MVKSGIIKTNAVEIDWFTITSFSYRFFEYWDNVARELCKERLDAKQMQYIGNEYKLDTGTLRTMKGHQRGQQHWLVTCSGQLAHMLIDLVIGMYDEDIPFKCTRLDIQCTIERPKNYDSMALMQAMSERKKNISYIRSGDKKAGRLATIGVGNRASQRYIRIYEKVLADDFIGLRLEAEYKGGLANNVLRDFSLDSTVLKECLLHELLKMKSKWMEKAFYMAIDANQPRKISGKVDKESKTKEWLISSCLPVLERIVRDHDNNGELAQLFLDIINHAVQGK